MFNKYINHYGTKKLNAIVVVCLLASVCVWDCQHQGSARVSSQEQHTSVLSQEHSSTGMAGNTDNRLPTNTTALIYKRVPAED